MPCTLRPAHARYSRDAALNTTSPKHQAVHHELSGCPSDWLSCATHRPQNRAPEATRCPPRCFLPVLIKLFPDSCLPKLRYRARCTNGRFLGPNSWNSEGKKRICNGARRLSTVQSTVQVKETTQQTQECFPSTAYAGAVPKVSSVC